MCESAQRGEIAHELSCEFARPCLWACSKARIDVRYGSCKSPTKDSQSIAIEEGRCRHSNSAM